MVIRSVNTGTFTLNLAHFLFTFIQVRSIFFPAITFPHFALRWNSIDKMSIFTSQFWGWTFTSMNWSRNEVNFLLQRFLLASLYFICIYKLLIYITYLINNFNKSIFIENFFYMNEKRGCRFSKPNKRAEKFKVHLNCSRALFPLACPTQLPLSMYTFIFILITFTLRFVSISNGFNAYLHYFDTNWIIYWECEW